MDIVEINQSNKLSLNQTNSNSAGTSSTTTELTLNYSFQEAISQLWVGTYDNSFIEACLREIFPETSQNAENNNFVNLVSLTLTTQSATLRSLNIIPTSNQSISEK